MKIEIVLTRGSVNLPCDEDLVNVGCEIRLPVHKETGCLVDELIFGGKVELLEEELYEDWGRLVEEDEPYRCRYFSVSANTFAEASKIAIVKAKQALEPLKAAIEERRKVLKQIGKFQPKKITIQI